MYKFGLLLIGLTVVITGSYAIDSATQGPNPQDIATPEPEYIDIDLPPPPGLKLDSLIASVPALAPAPAPAPIPQLAPLPIQISQPAPPKPIFSNFIPQQQPQQQQQFHHQPQPYNYQPANFNNHIEPVPAHSLTNDGYQYKAITRIRYRYRI